MCIILYYIYIYSCLFSQHNTEAPLIPQSKIDSTISNQEGNIKDLPSPLLLQQQATLSEDVMRHAFMRFKCTSDTDKVEICPVLNITEVSRPPPPADYADVEPADATSNSVPADTTSHVALSDTTTDTAHPSSSTTHIAMAPDTTTDNAHSRQIPEDHRRRKSLIEIMSPLTSTTQDSRRHPGEIRHTEFPIDSSLQAKRSTYVIGVLNVLTTRYNK